MANVIDITQNQFMEEVVLKSKTTPVLVDFWAPWCGPCKQLTPVLEKLINKKNGKVILVKINVDENQDIAAKLNIQSIPTVYGFVDGKPIDAFQGAQPESKIELMLDKMIDATPGNEIPKLITDAENLFREQNFESAKNIYQQLISLEPGNAKILSGLLRCLMQLKNYSEAQELIESLNDEMLQDTEIIKIKKLLENTADSNDVSINDLKSKLDIDPLNLDLKFGLANAYLQNNETENGFNQLLEIYKISSKWNEEAAKKKLLEYFDLLGSSDLNVIEARKKLSSLMFR